MTPNLSLADEILAAPRPVLFLDTCILLDIIRAANRKELGLDAINSAITLRDRMRAVPPAYYLVGSSILGIEFRDDQTEVSQNLRSATTICDLVLTIGESLGVVQAPLPNATDIIKHVTDLATDLFQLTRCLPEDNECKTRAFTRVLRKRPPTKGGAIKDAYLFEQCLAFCHSLHAGGFSERLILCSSNTSDFSDPKGSSTRLHPEMASEADQVSLVYYTTLFAAVGSLGTPPTSQP